MDKLKPGDLIINVFNENFSVDFEAGIFLDYGLNFTSRRKTMSLSKILLDKKIIQLPTETIEKYKG